MPGTTTRDLCLIRALLATFRLPATRAQEFSRATRARLPLEAIWSRARAAIHETRRHFLAVRAAHRIGGTCVRRFTRQLPCPFLFSEAPLPQAHAQPLCDASRTGNRGHRLPTTREWTMACSCRRACIGRHRSDRSRLLLHRVHPHHCTAAALSAQHDPVWELAAARSSPLGVALDIACLRQESGRWRAAAGVHRRSTR